MAEQARALREVVEFRYNEPEEVALKYATGKSVSGVNGDRVMFSLSDDRVMFLDLGPAQMVNRLGAKVGETFGICTRRKGNGPVEWDVWLSPSTEKGRARAEGVRLTSDAAARDPLEQALSEPLTPDQVARAAERGKKRASVVRGAALDPEPPNLAAALKAAVAAAHAAGEYARSIGLTPVPAFTGGDLCAMAVALLHRSER